MIGILQNKHLTLDKLAEIENKHLENFKKMLDKKKIEGKKEKVKINGELKNDEEIEKLAQSLFKAINIKNFDELVNANFDRLCELKNKIDKIDYTNVNINFDCLKELFNNLYATFRKTYARQLVEDLEITVCPYCNRNFINNTKKYAMAQFDHFFPKSKYPMLALSLYNLIPCCPQCNHNKLEKELSYSPYNIDFTTDKLLQFKAKFVSVNDFEIEIIAKNEIIKENIDKLLLKEAYAVHKPLVKEIYLKVKMYSDCYIQSLNNLVKDSVINIDMTFDELWYGNYLTEDKYYLRPLSKLTHDMIEEFRNAGH